MEAILRFSQPKGEVTTTASNINGSRLLVRTWIVVASVLVSKASMETTIVLRRSLAFSRGLRAISATIFL